MSITDEDVYDYLEHFGVKGMRWGVRQKVHNYYVKRQQEEVDVLRRVASGKGGKVDKALVGLTKSGLDIARNKNAQEIARERLDKSKEIQTKILAGEAKARAVLAKISGVHIKELNYAYDK